MENGNEVESHTARRVLLSAYAAALAAAFTVSLPPLAYAHRVIPPPVPDDIQVPAGNQAFLVGHAVGTQNYLCLPCPNAATAACPVNAAVAWILFTPQATLFKDTHQQVTTHFFSPNPFEENTNPGVAAAGAIRATWQDSRDTSTVWGQVKPGNASSDPDFVAADAIAWLLVTAVGAQDGPTGGDTLTPTTFIQRLNTAGGLAPSTGCASEDDVGAQAFVPYTADYFFYKATRGHPYGRD
jgi:hypothetical protein